MRVAHLAIAVPALEPAIEVWTRLLGITPHPIEALPNQGVRSCGYHLDNLVIELVEPLGEESPLANFLAKRGTGIHHIAFHTDDLAASLAAKSAQGFLIIPPRPGEGAEGMQVTFLHPKSTAGVLVEFVQPAHADAAERLRSGGIPVDGERGA